jgi:hypothetical protein
MATVQSSVAVTAELNALLTSMSTTAQLYVYDAIGNQLSTVSLPNPPGMVFNQTLVLLGMPQTTVVSSLAPIGAVPATVSIMNATQLNPIPIVTGIPISEQPNSIVCASSAVTPGGQLVILGGSIIIPK